MKKSIKDSELFNSVFLLQPGRPILCTTKNSDGSNHVAPFSWINPVSYKPPRVALALLNDPKKQQSLGNIERTGEFVVNLPGFDLAEKIVETSYSTKFGENKFERSGFTSLASVKVEPQGIEECKAHLECKVINSINAGDHTLLIADVVHASYDEEAFSPSLLMKIEKFMPAVHIFNFNLEQSQLHIFLAPGSTHSIEVPYPKEKIVSD